MDDQSGRRPAWLSKDLFPFGDQYADIDGARVHYVDGGTGPPLLLLHGNPTWSPRSATGTPDPDFRIPVIVSLARENTCGIG